MSPGIEAFVDGASQGLPQRSARGIRFNVEQRNGGKSWVMVLAMNETHQTFPYFMSYGSIYFLTRFFCTKKHNF